jgi:hypothetical protein
MARPTATWKSGAKIHIRKDHARAVGIPQAMARLKRLIRTRRLAWISNKLDFVDTFSDFMDTPPY